MPFEYHDSGDLKNYYFDCSDSYIYDTSGINRTPGKIGIGRFEVWSYYIFEIGVIKYPYI